MAPPPTGPVMTQVIDTVYRADGVTAAGTVLIFVAGLYHSRRLRGSSRSLSVKLGNGGAFSASLATNTGAQPAGVYYKVVYQQDGQQS